ncbi:MAG TPA: hypothetical protein VJS45_10385 [Acidimicrobiia bacterium]|nr:hypothetical protein [Acidimicrobiia bacterium]
MHVRRTVAASLLAGFLLLGAACGDDEPRAAAAPSGSQQQATAATNQLRPADLRQELRRLWEDHITWTRLYIVSALSGLPDANVTAERLLRNQDDIGNAIQPFYGDEAGKKLTELLRGHITGAAELLGAAKAGDQEKLAAAKTAWYGNGDEIATFLSQANPQNWPLDSVKSMMRGHLDQTIAEAVHRLEGKHADEIADYDQIKAHILAMSDTLSGGIVAQFPDRFSAEAPSGSAMKH